MIILIVNLNPNWKCDTILNLKFIISVRNNFVRIQLLVLLLEFRFLVFINLLQFLLGWHRPDVAPLREIFNRNRCAAQRHRVSNWCHDFVAHVGDCQMSHSRIAQLRNDCFADTQRFEQGRYIDATETKDCPKKN